MKINGWKMTFPFWDGLFSEAILVSGLVLIGRVVQVGRTEFNFENLPPNIIAKDLMVVFISVVEAAMEIILQVVAAKRMNYLFFNMAHMWLTVSGYCIYQPTSRGLYTHTLSRH